MFCSSFFFSLQEGMSGKTELWSRSVLCKNAEALLSKLLSLHFLYALPFLFYASITVSTILFSSKVPSLKSSLSISLLGSVDLMQMSFLVFPPFPLQQLSLPALFLDWTFLFFFKFIFHCIMAFKPQYIANHMLIPSLVPWPNICCPHLHDGCPPLQVSYQKLSLAPNAFFGRGTIAKIMCAASNTFLLSSLSRCM